MNILGKCVTLQIKAVVLLPAFCWRDIASFLKAVR